MKRINGLIALAVACTAAQAFGAALRVDIGQDNGRRDMLAPGAQQWLLGGAAASTTFGDVKLTLRGAEGGEVRAVSSKAGIDTGAVLSCDGAAGQPGKAIELVISGLAPGKHTLATWHNVVDAKGGADEVQVGVNGSAATTARQTSRVESDYDAANAFVTFDAQAGKDVVVTFTPGDSGVVYLNGLELDGGGDPSLRAAKPIPADGDEHANPDDLTLSWGAARSPGRAAPPPNVGSGSAAMLVEAAEKRAKEVKAGDVRKADGVKYDVYFGTSEEAVANATKSSKEFVKTTGDTSFAPKDASPWSDYYWRVDTVNGDEKSTAKGEVWHFRVARLAFPGAEGYGRFARGGRGGRVIEVTNLDDAGPGSLREAVEAEGPRTVVFRVGGTIQLKSKLIIRNPYITIAGQTAPGDGIATNGYTFGFLGAKDAIVRHMRIRLGDTSGQTMDGTGFASSDHCIMDHCSVAWSIDEGVSSRGARNITFQRSIVTEPLNVANHQKYQAGKGHGFAGSISGDIGSYHHNLVANAAGRNWSLAGGLKQGGKFAGYLDIRNNVVWNWAHRTTDGGVRKLNFVNNYYIPGPATKVFHLVKAEMELKMPDDLQQYYISGNVMEGRKQYDADNWKNGGVIGPDAAAMKLAKPFAESYVTTQSAADAYKNVIADVGPNIPKLDPIDQRAVDGARERKTYFNGSKTGLPGIIDSQNDAGGLPELKGGTPPVDTDKDGIPDEWEKAHKLDPNDASDGNKVGKDDYTNLELYLNDIVEQAKKSR